MFSLCATVHELVHKNVWCVCALVIYDRVTLAVDYVDESRLKRTF